MKYFYLLFFTICVFSGNLYGQKYDSLDVKEAEKFIVTNPEEAFLLGQKVYNDSKLDNSFRVRLLLSLLNASNQTQRFSEAIRYGTEGLVLAENTNDVISQIKFLGTLGNIYQSLQVNDKTKDYLNRAEELLNKDNTLGNDNSLKGNILYLKGMNYAYTLDCDMAVKYFDEAIRIYKSRKDPLSHLNMKLTYLNKAYCLIDMNNLVMAERYLILLRNECTIESSPTIPKFYSDIIMQSVELGFAKILTIRNDFESSNKILFDILNVKEQLNISDIEPDIYLQLSKNYLKMGNIKRSNFYDALYRQKMIEKNKTQVQIFNDLLVQEKKISQQKEDIQNNKNVQWSIIIIVILGFFICFLAFIFFKIRKTNKTLKKELYDTDK